MKDQAEHYYKEGFDFFKKGQYTKSFASCDKALAINRITPIHGTFAESLLVELGRPPEAFDSFIKIRLC